LDGPLDRSGAAVTIALLALAAVAWLSDIGQSGNDRRSAGLLPRPRSTGRPIDSELAWLPLILDLTAAGLAAGLPLAAALRVATPSRLPWLGARLQQVAGMLRLGADPQQAWSPLASESQLRPLVVIAIRSATSGIRLAASMRELAVEVRADMRAASLARAQRAGVWVIMPLGLCFLPAFICLGIIPVMIGIASSLHA
jgi:pilus assembly protein TadC